jgi:metal-sulfur cluster biosynthetic enzyme
MTGAEAGTNRPEWAAENTDPELAQKLKEGFTEIIDPEIGFNIIQLGLIRDVNISPEQTDVTMILTTPFCPYGPAMIETTKQKAEEVLDRPAKVNMGVELWDFSMMEEGLGNDWGLYY